jgi:hypothetical protein
MLGEFSFWEGYKKLKIYFGGFCQFWGPTGTFWGSWGAKNLGEWYQKTSTILKMGKSPGVKFEFGRLPERKIPPETKERSGIAWSV